MCGEATTGEFKQAERSPQSRHIKFKVAVGSVVKSAASRSRSLMLLFSRLQE